MRVVLSAALAALTAAIPVTPTRAQAEAKPALSEFDEIRHGLTIIAIADRIRKNCDSIDPRMMRAYSKLTGIKNMANELGYSDDEIRDFVEAGTHKHKIENAAYAYLVAKGVDLEIPETYCPVGHAEIARNSEIGVLLKAK